MCKLMKLSIRGVIPQNSWMNDEDKQTPGETTEKGEEKKVYSFQAGAMAMIKTGPLNPLLLCTPIAFFSYWYPLNDGVTFVFALLALAPFAERLGFCTEQLAMHTNDTIGGLLNATFGNATELIVAIAALQKDLLRLVQLSLLGSILSNLLLVLGCAFFFGGLRFKTQKFNKISSQINSTLMLLSSFCVMFAMILSYANEENHKAELQFSRATSVILFTLYILFLYFQLFTHPNMFDAEEDSSEEENKSLVKTTKSQTPDEDVETPANPATGTTAAVPAGAEPPEEEEEDEDILGFNFSLVWLGIITVFIAILSEAVAATIEAAAQKINISSIFLSVIVLPIVGNAAEHASAIIFAMKDNLDLSLGVAVGSSTQIALMVLPLIVIIGWCMGKDMSLNFGPYESFSMFITIIMVTFSMKDGTSNWLMGAMLVLSYIVVGAGFLVQRDENLN